MGPSNSPEQNAPGVTANPTSSARRAGAFDGGLVYQADESRRSHRPVLAPEQLARFGVGDRVLAHNPEVSPSKRAAWQEPNWGDWLHLTLAMPLPVPEGTELSEPPILNIELLRPESWFRDQVQFLVDDPDPSTVAACEAEASAAEADPIALDLVPLSPLGSIYRDLALTAAILEESGQELLGIAVEMDLPEMGAAGTAMVKDVRSAPKILLGQRGQVVTATFSHPPTHQVLDVRFEGESDPIGVTSNHLFWSADRERFLAIGEMEIGERVTTYRGETKRIESQLPRPGPQTVHNLEVYGEHVYFVGKQGLLAHNAYDAPSPGAVRQTAGLSGPKVASNDILATPNRLQNKLAAWRRYDGDLSLGDWSKRYDQLQINAARGRWREQITRRLGLGEPGSRIYTPVGDRIPDAVDGAILREIKNGYVTFDKFTRKQIGKDFYLPASWISS